MPTAAELDAADPLASFLYVRAEHQDQLSQPIWGWLGRADPFAMGPGYVPGPGIARFLSGTPAILGLAGRSRRDRAPVRPPVYPNPV